MTRHRVRRRRSSVLIPVVLAASIVSAAFGTTARAQDATGSIDLAAANHIVDSYFRHVLEQLPRDWREAEERKLRDTQPRIGPHGIFQINGPRGTLAFEFDEAKRTLFCYVVISKVRSDFPRIGLSQEQILTALRIWQRRQDIDLAGGEIVYDEVANGFFLRRVYTAPPGNDDRLADELDRLTAAGEAWFRGHYLEAVRSHAETLKPPDSATARDGDLRATIVLTLDPRYMALWDRPPTAPQPLLVSLTAFSLPADLFIQMYFAGATADDDGQARVEGKLSFFYPNGQSAGTIPVPLWNEPPPPGDHLQIGRNHTEITFERDRPPGRYLVRGQVCDVVAERCVTVEHPFDVTRGSAPVP